MARGAGLRRAAVTLPLRVLADEWRGATVEAVVKRLQCGQCSGRPAYVALIEDGAAGASGRGESPEGWRVGLFAAFGTDVSV